MTKLRISLAALALAPAALGLAACGGDDETSSTSAGSTTGGGETVAFTADPDGSLAYTETEVEAKAGPATIEFDNPASLSHDVVIEDGDGNEIARTDVIAGDSTSTDAELEAGEFTFYCSVDSHREAGMEGTLTVN
jgi:plastocyanin